MKRPTNWEGVFHGLYVIIGGMLIVRFGVHLTEFNEFQQTILILYGYGTTMLGFMEVLRALPD